MPRRPRNPYFAYGMNMDVAAMAHRCPGAKLIGRGSLPGFRFGINPKGVATVIADRDSTVFGLIWDLPPRDELSLDAFEGVRDGHYRKRRYQARLEGDDDPLACMVYQATRDRPARPRRGYLETVIKAAAREGLPETYVNELRLWLGRHAPVRNDPRIRRPWA